LIETHASRFRSTVLHPFLSIALPFLFLLSVCAAVNGAAVRLSGDAEAVTAPLFGIGFIVLLFALQAEEAVGSYLVRRERAGALLRVRELAVLLTVCYLILALARHDGGNRFVPNGLFVAKLLILGTGWVLSLVIHLRLHALETFYTVRGRRRGNALHHAIRQAAHVAGEARTGLLQVRRAANVFLFLLGAAILILWFAGLPPDRATLLAGCAYCAAYIVSRAVLALSVDEVELAGDGLVLPKLLIRKRVTAAAILGAAALLVALFCASDRSLLPPELLSRFFAWLAGLFPQPGTPPALPPRQAPAPTPLPDLGRMMGALPQLKPIPWLSAVWAVLRFVGIAVGAGLILLFVIGPVFSRDFRSFLRRINPLSATLRFFLRGLRTATRWLRRAVRAFRRLLVGGSSDAASEQLPYGPRPERIVFSPDRRKRLEMDRVRREFFRLVEWGERAGARRIESATADEYAGALARIVPESAGSLASVVEIFDEAVYSRRPIGRERIQELRRSVDEVVRN